MLFRSRWCTRTSYAGFSPSFGVCDRLLRFLAGCTGTWSAPPGSSTPHGLPGSEQGHGAVRARRAAPRLSGRAVMGAEGRSSQSGQRCERRPAVRSRRACRCQPDLLAGVASPSFGKSAVGPRCWAQSGPLRPCIAAPCQVAGRRYAARSVGRGHTAAPPRGMLTVLPMRPTLGTNIALMQAGALSARSRGHTCRGQGQGFGWTLRGDAQ